MTPLLQSFIYTIWMLTIYNSLRIINFVYIKQNISFQLPYSMVPWYYYLINQILLLLIFSFVIIIGMIVVNQIKEKEKKIIFFINKKHSKISILFSFFILELIAFIYMLNIKLYETVDQILNFYWIKKGIIGLQTNTTELKSQLVTEDYIFFLIPFLFFLFIKFNLHKQIYKYLSIALVLLTIIFSLIFFYSGNKTEKKINSMAPNLLNPFLEFIFDIENYLNPLKIPNKNFNKKQQNSIKLISKELIIKSDEYLKVKNNNQKMNVMILLMESAGFKYIRNTAEKPSDKTAPMPFLNKLANNGVFFEHMYSNAGATAGAIFGLTTGLNIYTGDDTVLSKTLYFPTINKYATEYNVFFEHASDMNTWFPKRLLNNNNMEIKDMNDMVSKYPKNAPKLAIKEKYAFNEFINDFINKVKNKKKVIGYYLNYNTHFPYFYNDIGKYTPDKKYIKQINKQNRDNGAVSIERYYKALNYYDFLLKKAFFKLKKAGVLKNTIIIILGDHGESFGQHNFWTHGNVYENIVKIPCVIWQPKLFKPQIIKSYVSQIDLIPTILDLTHQHYNDNKIQGISLLKRKKRKFLYTFQLQHMLINTKTQKKIIMSENLKNCSVFNIKEDPNETNKLDCKNFKNLQNNLYKYINYQHNILIKYNNKLKKELKKI